MKSKLKETFLALDIFIILAASIVFIVLNFNLLYEIVLDFLNLSEKLNLPKGKIISDYTKATSFVLNPSINTLKFENFTLSENGYIHFIEVKNIVLFLELIFFISIVIFIVYIVYIFQYEKSFPVGVLNKLFYIITIPIGSCLLWSIIDFNSFFEIFHKILFRNDYWIFD